MNIRQLRFFCEIANKEFNLSSAAAALRTSQPSVSRQIQALERELGIQIFKRSKKRVLGFTDAGKEAIRVARQMVRDADDLQQIGRDFGDSERGELTIAASHTSARYILPPIIKKFAMARPGVKLLILPGNPSQIGAWIDSGEADIAMVGETMKPVQGVSLIPCYEHHRIVLTLPGHPLVNTKQLSLEKLSAYPLITHDSKTRAYTSVMQAFENKGLVPNIVLRATDVDVMKAYVKCGLGIAITSNIAYNSQEDRAFRCLNAEHLFGLNTIHVGFKRTHYVRPYVFDFVRLVAPKLQRTELEQTSLVTRARRANS